MAMDCARRWSALTGVMLCGNRRFRERGPTRCRVVSGATIVPLVRALYVRGLRQLPAGRSLAVGAISRASDSGSAGDSRSRSTSTIGIGWVGPTRFRITAWTRRRQYAAMRANGAHASSVTPQVLLQGHEFPAGLARTPKSDAGAGRPRRRRRGRRSRSTAAGASARTIVGQPPQVQSRRSRLARRARSVIDRLCRQRPGRQMSKPARTGACNCTHDHVVTRVQGHAPATSDQSKFQCALHRSRANPASRRRWSAIVRTRSTGDVLQALALPLDRRLRISDRTSERAAAAGAPTSLAYVSRGPVTESHPCESSLAEDDALLGDAIAAHLRRRRPRCRLGARRRRLPSAALRAQAFELVVLDLGLPRQSGREVLRRLREPRSASTPVLIVTAADAIGRPSRRTGRRRRRLSRSSRSRWPSSKRAVRALIQATATAATATCWSTARCRSTSRRATASVGGDALDLSAREARDAGAAAAARPAA